MYEAAIYGLRCECGCERPEIRYIGLTTQQLATRLTNHRGQARFGTDTPVYNWMRKHGPENIRIDLLLESSVAMMDADEARLIAETPGLLNISPGGEGGVNRGKKRPEHSQRMRGEGHPACILTEADVLEIRAKYVKKYGEQTRLARKYGVTSGTIYDIVNRVSWRHI